MASQLILRCQFKGGQRKVLDGLTKDCSISQLQEKVFILTGVSPHRQRVLSGFPPKELNLSNSNASLNSMSIKSGDTLIVEENKMAPILAPGSNSFCESRTGILTRKIVRADNSCLFASLSYLLFGGDVSLSRELRQLAAKCISEDPSTFNEAVLGRPNEEYCKWILDPTHWGGGIEITALSKYYKMEIAVVDIQTGRVDKFADLEISLILPPNENPIKSYLNPQRIKFPRRTVELWNVMSRDHLMKFGQNERYPNRVYLIYDGIHYDPLAKENSNSSGEPLKTTFSVNDDSTLMEASSLATEAREKRQFTSLSGFSLRCLTCQTALKGQLDATNHAKLTGHTNFGEV